MRRERALRIVLVLLGLLFCTAVYPLLLMDVQPQHGWFPLVAPAVEEVTKAACTSETTPPTRTLPVSRIVAESASTSSLRTSHSRHIRWLQWNPLRSVSPAADLGRSASPREPSTLWHGLDAAIASE